jgi:hypothetical protein
MKIYIHHYYNKSTFYKVAHNTTNRIFNIKNKEGNVLCKYNNIDIEFIFKKEISFENDGYHLLDYFSCFLDLQSNNKIDKKIEETEQVLNIFVKELKRCPINQKWIIVLIRTEKIIGTKNANINNPGCISVENLIKELNNHIIISDNLILTKNLELEYPNIKYALTNVIYQWNEILGIRWFYEFKKIFDKLNFDYDLMYSIKNHKLNRVTIINELSKLNNSKLYLQHTDALQNIKYELHSSKILDTNINLNSIYGDNDFDDIEYIINHRGYMDVFFRVLPKAKMQILCESWSWNNKEFTSQYFSEKTISLLLAGIPFISTHEYPLQMIQSIFDVPPHPFYNDSKRCKTNGKLFAEFVNVFLENFNENYKLCKDWSDLVHTKLMYKIENENSLLDLIIEGGLKKEFVVKKTLI